MTITLYAAPMSSALPVVHAFHELDVPHDLVLLDLQAGAQRTADFLALNPNGKVPTLVVDGTPMFEALAILQWLGDRYGVERGLWPAADAPERLEALSWSTWMYVSFSSAFKRLSVAAGSHGDPALHHEGQAGRAREEVQDMLTILDRRLAERHHLVGDRFTLVDLIVGSGIAYASFAGVDTAGHANVERWLARLQRRPAYQKAWATA